jgi:hypothetical protein
MDLLEFPIECTHPTAAAPWQGPDKTQDIWATAISISVASTAAAPWQRPNEAQDIGATVTTCIASTAATTTALLSEYQYVELIGQNDKRIIESKHVT